jgi:hypothetical protein
MGIKQLSLACAATVLFCAAGNAIATPTVGLYVVPGIFFDDAAPDAGGGTNSSGGSSKIDPAFRGALNIPSAVSLLQTDAQALFPALVANVDSTNRRRTLALSVQVTRASRYVIPKTDGTTDIYLPVTLSAYISNPMTGEVLQSFSQTHYEVLTVSGSPTSDANQSKVDAAYRGGFSTLLNSVLSTAAAQFKPYVAEAKVADTWRGYVILNQGYQAGIGQGDIMDDGESEIRVEYSGQHYAVAVPVLGKPKDGAVFSRPVTMALTDVKKPRVMALVSDGNPDLSDAVSTQLFADRLGSSAPFATLPLNANFSQVQASIDSHTGIGHAVSGERSLPDYFIRMVIPPAKSYTLPTNLTYKTQQSYEAWAFAELVSRNGRVLYAADINDRIDDTITDGSGFNPAARREIVLKNSLTDLADRFSKEIQFKPVVLKVSDTSADTFQIDDPDMNLQVGDHFRVYHDAGKPGDITEDVLVPTWDGTVASRDGSKVVASAGLQIAGNPPKPSSGDVVVMDNVGSSAGAGQRTAFCPAEKSQVGSIAEDRFNWFAYAGAAHSSLLMVDPALASLVQDKVGGQSGFASNLELAPAKYDRCLEALYRIDPSAQKCDGGVCTEAYTVRLGYREKSAGQVTSQAIMEHAFTSRGYPEPTGSQDVAALQSIDLDADTRTSLDVVMKQLLNKNQ